MICSLKNVSSLLSYLILVSCSSQKQLGRTFQQQVMRDENLSNAHIGIMVVDTRTQKPIFQYQHDKFFVPASNTKIFTCYAGMKFLGDSITGIEYSENDTAIFLMPTGDPTLLHGDFKTQPVVDFLRSATKPLYITDVNWNDRPLGSGWSWDDYSSYYMAERSPLPVYGNVIRWIQEKDTSNIPASDTEIEPQVFTYSVPDVNWKVRFNAETGRRNFSVSRSRHDNEFTITQGEEKSKIVEVPFVTHGLQSALELLPDAIDKPVVQLEKSQARFENIRTIYSRPTDSVLIPMMHRSDNFFAEQVLLMVANERYGQMNDNIIIDSLLNNELKDLPQRPRWADGSGLSRFNLFTPADFVAILAKMKDEFGMDRVRSVFATGGEGTLLNFYKSDSSFIYAKTGTLSGVVALSGFLYTRKNKLLTFSVLVNNHRGNAVAIRRQVESFLSGLRNKY